MIGGVGCCLFTCGALFTCIMLRDYNNKKNAVLEQMMKNQNGGMPMDVMQGQGVADDDDDDWAYGAGGVDDGKKSKRKRKKMKGGMAVMDFYGNQGDGYDEDGVYVARAVGAPNGGAKGGDSGDGAKPQNMNSRINYQREQMKKKHRDQDGGAFNM